MTRTTRVGRLLVCAAVLALSVRPAAAAPRVTRLARVPAAWHGEARGALPGDYLLANRGIELVISDLSHAGGYAEHGGNVLDCASPVNHLDALGEVYVYLQGDFLHQAHYTALRVSPPGADPAWIEVEGHDAWAPGLVLRTRYAVSGDVPRAEITTTLVNRADSSIAGYRLGDVVQWALADHFAPGPGRALVGKTLRAPWLAGTAEGVAYAYAAADSLSARHGATWSNATLTLATLAPGESVTVRRWLAVAPRGDVEAALGALRATGVTGAGDGRLACTVRGDARLSRGLVEIRDATGRLVRDAAAGADTTWFALPAGDYTVGVRAPEHPAAAPVRVRVSPGGVARVDLALAPTGHVSFEAIDEETGRALPAKFTVEPADSLTPEPDFGPVTRAAGAAHVLLTADGHAASALRPGRYRVTASRGLEYSIDVQTLVVTAGVPQSARFRLRHVLDTRGYLGADFHQHTIRSHDSSLPLVDRIVSDLAEGLDLVVATDHDVVTDYRPTVRRLHATRLLAPVIGNEVSTQRLGHFIAFPLTRHPGAHGDGALEWRGLTPRQIFDALHALPGRPIVQVNHPRDGRLGYFTQVGLDSLTGAPRGDSMSLAFDALEIMNGKRVDQAEIVLADWFHLLNRGATITATGNSDSHQVFGQEAGSVRNLVWLGTDDPQRVRLDALVAAVRAHRIVVTDGPMIHFAADDGTPLGGTVHRAPGAGPLGLEVRVDAAPWVDVSSVHLIANGVVIDSVAVAPSDQVVRLTRRFPVQPARDTWYVVVVRGTRDLSPVLPADNGHHATPFALTNPIWVDVDGNGRFDAPEAAR